jgi:hypothetical protein
VVSGEFPPYSLITGNPGSVKRRRFSDEIIAEMLKIEWWHWNDEKIISHISDFYGPIEEFVAKHRIQD